MAYRGLAKECHPDYLGNEGHNICILLNEVGVIPSRCHSQTIQVTSTPPETV